VFRRLTLWLRTTIQDCGLTETAPGRRVVIVTYSDSEARICHALERGARGYLLLGGSLQDLVDGIRSVHDGGVAVGRWSRAGLRRR